MADEAYTKRLERNLPLYTAYLIGRETYFWMPVFFLYFSSKLPLDQVLLLEAIYYGAYVVLEVPSGYISDRLGRRATLIASSVFLVASYGLFFWGASWLALATAQVLLAAGLSFASGTDTSFHFETLQALGRDDEYGDREARLGRLGAWAMGLGALSGGALGLIDIRWAYFASAVSALLCLGASFFITEPEHQMAQARPWEQLRRVAERARSPELWWLFGIAVLGVVLNHVPYEFYQSYLALTVESVSNHGEFAPLVAGMHATLAAIVAGMGAGVSVKWARRWGRQRFLLLVLLFQTGIVLAMGLVLHPVVALLLVGRGLSGAMMKPVLRTAIAPRVAAELHATYFSMQSLAGRLGFSAMLILLSVAVPADGHLAWADLSTKVLTAGAICSGILVVLGFGSLFSRSDDPTTPP